MNFSVGEGENDSSLTRAGRVHGPRVLPLSAFAGQTVRLEPAGPRVNHPYLDLGIGQRCNSDLFLVIRLHRWSGERRFDRNTWLGLCHTCLAMNQA